ncbi:MAG: tetratricopeptide repeat protein [Chthoniobacterales bacterium]
MAAELEPDLHLEIAHVLFMDIVGFSKLLINEQAEILRELNQIVRSTDQFRKAEAAEELIRLPTGDGMVLVFLRRPEAPVQCAVEISRALRNYPQLRLRMGIHSGPVNQIKDVNDRSNLTGAGINTAQRVMDCGNAGHILLSKRVAEDLAHYRQWQPLLHDLGEAEVKHSERIVLINFYSDEIGNPELPEKFTRGQAHLVGKGAAKSLAFSSWQKPSSIIAAFVIIAALAAGFWFFSHQSASRRANAGSNAAALAIPEKSIAVLPFENLSRDPDNAYFTDGIQEEILTRLAKVADLKVISRTSTACYLSSPGNLPEIANKLGVANILEGSVQRAGEQVRINVQLIKATTDAHLWADTYDRKLTDIFAVESEIAKTIADTLKAKLTGSEEHAIAVRPTEDLEAHQLYLKGRYFWNKRTGNDVEKSIGYFNQAIAADPKHALAYAGVADAYALLPAVTAVSPRESFSKAEAAARKALALDDTLAEAHSSLAASLCYYDFDFAQAAREFQRAIELNPNYATAHQWYGIVYFAAQGRFDEAISEVKRALELDPLSLIINSDLGRTYYFARRYDEAVEQLHKTLEMDSNFFFAHRHLGCVLEVKGDFPAAIKEYQKARELNDDPRVLALLGHVFAVSGNKTEAIKILDQMKALSQGRYVSAYSFALLYLGLGDKNEALRWLEQSYQDRFPEITRIKVEPLLDPLRGDPRFQALAEKVIPLATK